MQRPSAAQRGYDSKWSVARRAFLKANPHCVKCGALGLKRNANVVDHKTPHKGDRSLFWDRKNWQALCSRCHNSAKQKEENRGYVVGCDANGKPVDPNHPWNSNR